MKIVADENIPLVFDLFAGFGEIVTKSGREILRQDLVDADVLLVRSVTKVNETLLADTPVRFVGTCTIGTDHLDMAYLDAAGVHYASAPGCNAWGVVQYDLAAMAELSRFRPEMTVGIVGCGNVGGRLHRVLRALGISCVCYDPFLTLEENSDLAEWSALFECDVVCLHTPLTRSGPHPTYHMIDHDFFSRMKADSLLLNAGRGEVIDNLALRSYLAGENRNRLAVVLDVWENEPAIDPALALQVDIGTPHIAGYSYEGKTNGSLMIFDALARFLALDSRRRDSISTAVKSAAYGEPEPLQADSLVNAVLSTYPIQRDHLALRQMLNELPEGFDHLRKNYPVRREFSHYQMGAQAPDGVGALGFIVSHDV